MQLDPITMDRTEARAAFLAYRRAVRDRHDAEDAEIMRGYRALARGHQLVVLPDVMRAGGVTLVSRRHPFERDAMQTYAVPRLAIARAHVELCWTGGIEEDGDCELRSKRELAPS